MMNSYVNLKRQSHNKDGLPDIAEKDIKIQEHNGNYTSYNYYGDTYATKIGQIGDNPERTRRISQYSKEVVNLGHSHQGKFQAKEDKLRRISQFSRTSEVGDVGSERQRKISHYRDGGLLKDAVIKYGTGRAGTRKEHERYSVITSGGLEASVPLENTFQLGPGALFIPSKVKEIIKNVLEEKLGGKKYDSKHMADQCLILSDMIKEKVRQLRLDRFKIVTIVLIGEKKNQASIVSSRCLWNHEQDNFASCEFLQDNLSAVGMVFAVYQE